MPNGRTIFRKALVLVGIVLIWWISVQARLAEPSYLLGADGIEATYHALWTMQALDASPVAAHGFLPTVVIEPVAGDVLRWGATRATPGGALIYTSFPPLGFLAPWWGLTGVGAPLTLQSLFLFNTVAGLVTALLFGWFCAMVATRDAAGRRDPSVPAWPWVVGGAVGCLLLAETLVSQGFTYWPHALSQPVFVAACCLLLRRLTGVAGRWEAVGLVLLCALYCSLEWTGFVFVAGAALVLLLQIPREDRRPGRLLRSLPAALLMVAGLVLLATVLHFAVLIGPKQFAGTSAARAMARSGYGQFGLLLKLGLGYYLSVGLLLPLGMLAAAVVLLRRPAGWVWALAFLTAFPLVENLLLMNHAVNFPFDRMKAAVPLALACVLLLRQMPGRRQAWVGGLALGLIVLSNLHAFHLRTQKRAQWVEWDAGNHALVARVQQHPQADCAVAGSKQKVRGYLNLLFRRDIYEGATPEIMAEALVLRDGCATMIIESDYVMTDLPRVVSVEIRSPEGTLLERFE